jgi:hypothetical protein
MHERWKTKPGEDFGTNRAKPDGLKRACKACRATKAPPKPFAQKGHSQRMRAAAGDPTDELVCNTCDAQVTRAKAGQHMYEAHKQNVAVQRIDEFFEVVA